MKRPMIVTFVMLVVAVGAANAAPPAEEVAVNLVTGYCLSEKMGAALPAGAIDPRKSGTPVTSRDRLARLSSKALRLPTASGEVYYDYNENYCYAHASGVDPARTVASLESELNRRRIAFSKAPVKRPDGEVQDGQRSPSLVIMIDTPASSPTVPVIAITYFSDPNALSIGVALGR